MEREKEIAKLVNVLRRTARMAQQAEWTGTAKDSASFCVEQYNRVLARLREIDPDIAPIFPPLPADSSMTTVAMACRQLGAYYEDEVGRGHGWSSVHSVGFDPQVFKDFWCKSARDIEDLGEFIRQSIQEWARQQRGPKEKHEPKGPTESAS